MAPDDGLRTWTDDSVWRSGPAAFPAIRTMRHAPPGAAGKGTRFNAFTGSMEQAQQQITAARSVGYESRPLNLFYGLSQAGRAIAAAATGLNDKSWDLRGHGITANPGINGVTRVVDFPSMCLNRDDNGGPGGSFVRLLSLLSPDCDLSAGVSIQQLWACLPDALRTEPLTNACPAVLTLQPQGVADKEPAFFHGLLYTRSALLPSRAAGEISDEEIGNFLAPYPSLEGYRLRLGRSPWSPAWGREHNGVAVLVHVYWPRRVQYPDVDLSIVSDYERSILSTDYRGRDVVLPRVGSQDDIASLHPLLIWWAILFGLSMLCRYRPVVWTQLIDINRSQYASAIEHLLDLGLDAVPDLIERTIREVATERTGNLDPDPDRKAGSTKHAAS